MKISYITTFDASDVHNWSGLGYYMSRSLAEHAEIEYLGNLRIRNKYVQKLKKMYYDKVVHRSFLEQRQPAVAEGFASQVAKRISSSADCIFSPGSIPIARLESSRPKVFYTDACFAGMLGFYPSFSNLCDETIRNGNQLEQDALTSCSLAIYSSDWAAKTAMEHYRVDPSKVKVVPFGANINSVRTSEDIKRIIGRRSAKVCKLLFLGVDWERKGGPIALEIVDALNKAGIPAELHIAGIKELPVSPLPDFVRNYGFISKSNPEGRARIDGLMEECHFLLVPTRAEAYGFVFCEANSFGMPAIATKVGGVPTIIKDDINGKLFPLSAAAAAYADHIMNLFSQYKRYEDLALSSFNEFQSRLNWNVAGKKIVSLLEDL